jgi:hypothetical protein
MIEASVEHILTFIENKEDSNKSSNRGNIVQAWQRQKAQMRSRELVKRIRKSLTMIEVQIPMINVGGLAKTTS